MRVKKSISAIIEQLKERADKPKTYYVVTMGCQMNARDSEKLVGILDEIGCVASETEEAADLVIYNTCCVRENAEQKVYGRLGYLKSFKKKNPNMKIALCGCMMQEAHVVEKIKKSYRFVDIVFGTHNIFKLAELLYEDIKACVEDGTLCKGLDKFSLTFIIVY